MLGIFMWWVSYKSSPFLPLVNYFSILFLWTACPCIELNLLDLTSNEKTSHTFSSYPIELELQKLVVIVVVA